MVPRRFRDAANYLNDQAILETNALTTLIPFTVAKNNHAKFLHEHHSITIKGVPPSNYGTVTSINPIPQMHHQATLKAVLNSNKMITAIHENFDNRTITISTTDPYVPAIMTSWLSTILPMFPYCPIGVDDNNHTPGSKSGHSTMTGKYSKVFAAAMDTDSTSDTTFNLSTIASSRPS
jgi:hypothetical protein